MKRFKKILLILILICLIILGGVFIYSKYFTNYSRNKAISLLEKGINTTNYSIKYTSPDENITMYKKQNTLTIISQKEDQPTFTIYKNLDTDSLIIKDEEYALKGSLEKYLSLEHDVSYLIPYTENVLNNLKSDDYEYTYKDKISFNNEKCVVINLKNKNKASDNKTYAIDLKTGFICQTEELNSLGELKSLITFENSINSVTDEQVTEPDLESVDVREF